MVLKSCLLHVISQVFLSEILSDNSNLDNWGNSLPAFPSITKLKFHGISVAPKMINKAVTAL